MAKGQAVQIAKNMSDMVEIAIKEEMKLTAATIGAALCHRRGFENIERRRRQRFRRDRAGFGGIGESYETDGNRLRDHLRDGCRRHDYCRWQQRQDERHRRGRPRLFQRGQERQGLHRRRNQVPRLRQTRCASSALRSTGKAANLQAWWVPSSTSIFFPRKFSP